MVPLDRFVRGACTSVNAVWVTQHLQRGRNDSLENPFVHLQPKVALLYQPEIELKDPLENMGAQMVKEVASKPMTSGTATANCFAAEGLKR
jgi:chaperonin GroEL